MLFLVARVDIQVHQQFLHAQQTHHQGLQLVQQVVELIALMDLVKFSTELVDFNIELGHALGQTVVRIQKHSLGFAVKHFVDLGVAGLPLLEGYKKELEHVKTQTALLAQKHKFSAP
jgi:hypothetical protein